MSAFPKTLTSIAAPLGPERLADNVDTDAIIPSREMRTTGRTGLAAGLFAPWRYLDAKTREEDPDFVLNMPEFRETKVLIAGSNFGCGSSREHAVWALAEWGIRCVIAQSFAPIFQANCIRNFILPIALAPDALGAIAGREVTIDLAEQSVTGAGQTHTFPIDTEAKLMLSQGLDAIDLTLTAKDQIAAWTARDRAARPWVYLGAAA